MRLKKKKKKSLFSFWALSAYVWQLHFFFPAESCTSKFKSQEMLSVWTAQRRDSCEPPAQRPAEAFSGKVEVVETVEPVVEKVGLCGRWWEIVVRGKPPHHTGSRNAPDSILSSCCRSIYTDNTSKRELLCASAGDQDRARWGLLAGSGRKKRFKGPRAARHFANHTASDRPRKDVFCPMRPHIEKLDEFQGRSKEKSPKQNKMKIPKEPLLI